VVVIDNVLWLAAGGREEEHGFHITRQKGKGAKPEVITDF